MLRRSHIQARALLLSLSLAFLTVPVAYTQEGGMTDSEAYAGETEPDSEPAADPAIDAAARLKAAIAVIDPQAKYASAGANFTAGGVPITLIYDTNADRMRLIAGVISIDDVKTEDLLRMMQANFDSALDARYAVAQGIVWSTFIHPLTSLTDEDFASGIAQTMTLVHTYGTTYSSGAFLFNGGDAAESRDKAEEEAAQEEDKGI